MPGFGGIRFDAENQLMVAQAFTGAATVSTNSYAKQSAGQDISIATRFCLLFFPLVAPGAGSSTLFEVIEATDGALTTSIGVLASLTVAAANIKVGTPVEVPIPQGIMTKQYIGARITITGGTTTGTYDCYLMPLDEVPYYKSFPKAVDAGV